MNSQIWCIFLFLNYTYSHTISKLSFYTIKLLLQHISWCISAFHTAISATIFIINSSTNELLRVMHIEIMQIFRLVTPLNKVSFGWFSPYKKFSMGRKQSTRSMKTVIANFIGQKVWTSERHMRLTLESESCVVKCEKVTSWYIKKRRGN